MVSSNPYLNIYVYKNILENQCVGDYLKTPLLTVVHVQHGNYAYAKIFPKSHFLSISRKNISSIAVHI